MNDERFDIDVGYNDPQDPRDPEPEDRPSPTEYEEAAQVPDWPHHLEWEIDGVRAVIYNGRLSLYGKPSMSADDGTVAIGVDLP